MSQEKVDRYKKQKANRKAIMRKEKMMNIVRQCVVGVVFLVLVGWLGFSAYDMYEKNQPVQTVAVDYTAVTNYISLISGAQ